MELVPNPLLLWSSARSTPMPLPEDHETIGREVMRDPVRVLTLASIPLDPPPGPIPSHENPNPPVASPLPEDPELDDPEPEELDPPLPEEDVLPEVPVVEVDPDAP
jgi:hypothetical protein